MTRFVLIVAGGKGLRMGGNTPKQFMQIHGRPILAWTVDAFLQFDDALPLVIALPAEALQDWQQQMQQLFSAADLRRITCVPGGAERVHSVHQGLRAIASQLPAGEDALVAIHDGVRPVVSQVLIARAFELGEQKGNAVAAVPVKSSMRRLQPDGSSIAVNRDEFFHVQTPQVFRLSEILAAYEQRNSDSFTDDASLAEAQGMRIHLSAGAYENVKVTTPEDIALAQEWLKLQ